MQHGQRRVCLGWTSRSFTGVPLNDEAEQLSINLQAMPSFEAFGRFLETTNPFALWAQAVQMAWLPWLNAARFVTLPSPNITSMLPKLSSDRNQTASNE
jgi:hypothetical protein